MTPNLNAFSERVVQSIRQECLDHFVVFGSRHLNYLVGKYAQHYDDERVHMVTGRPPRGMPRMRDGETGMSCATSGSAGCRGAFGDGREISRMIAMAATEF